jgi:outer membrane protein assembly factor BamB
MRKSLPLTVLALAVLVFAAGCKNKAPKVPVLTGPTLVQVSSETDFTVTTTDANKDNIKYFVAWGDGDTLTTGYEGSGENVTVSHTWADTGWYSLRALAEDEEGARSADWSDSLYIHVVTDTGNVNNPPAAPAKPTATGAMWVDSTITFSSSTTDPDGDSVSIKFYFDDGQVSGWSPYVTGGTTVSAPTVYVAGGYKVVYAVARDLVGDTSAWSLPETILISEVNLVPRKPDWIAWPRRGIAGGPTYRFYARATDPNVNDTLRYIIYFGNGDSVVSDPAAQGTNGMGLYRPTGDTMTYTLTVKAMDRGGLVSDISDPVTFKTVGEGEIIYGFDDDFTASPALGMANSYGAMWPAVVVGSDEGNMHFIDAYLGAIIRTYLPVDAEEFQSSPAVTANGIAYAGNENGWFYAFDADGAPKWSYAVPDSGQGNSTTPLINGSDIYFGGEDRQLHKLTDNGASYTHAWAVALKNELIGSPAMDGAGNIVACDDSGYVHYITPAGTIQWSYRTGDTTGITSSPAIGSDGTIYLGTESGRLLAIKDNALLWSYETSPRSAISSSPILASNGNVFFSCDDGKIYQIDATSHLPVPGWPAQASLTPLTSTPALTADGYVYVVDDDEMLIAMGPDGIVRWQTALVVPPEGRRGGRHGSALSIDVVPSPAIDGYGIVYVSCPAGVFAVAGRAAGTLANTPWPMFHHDVRHSGKFGAR